MKHRSNGMYSSSSSSSSLIHFRLYTQSTIGIAIAIEYIPNGIVRARAFVVGCRLSVALSMFPAFDLIEIIFGCAMVLPACACVCILYNVHTPYTFECGCVYSFFFLLFQVPSSFSLVGLNNDAWVSLFKGTLLHFSILLKGEQDTSARSVHFKSVSNRIVGKCFVCYGNDTRNNG